MKPRLRGSLSVEQIFIHKKQSTKLVFSNMHSQLECYTDKLRNEKDSGMAKDHSLLIPRLEGGRTVNMC